MAAANPTTQIAVGPMLLAGAVRWKGGTHRSKPHTRPPRGKRAFGPGPKQKGRTQRGEKHKLKSHMGAMKRFFQKADGSWWHKAAGKNHLMAGSSRRRQTARKLQWRQVTTKGDIKKLNRLMPYGGRMEPPSQPGRPGHPQSRLWERPEGWTELFFAAKRKDGVEIVSQMMKADMAKAKAEEAQATNSS